MNAPFQVFDTNTYRHRMQGARQVLRELGASAAMMVAPQHQFYFGGFDSWTGVNSPQAIMFTPGADDPTLVLRNVDLSLATESTWLYDVLTYQPHADCFELRRGVRNLFK